jgi:hypothetical protein
LAIAFTARRLENAAFFFTDYLHAFYDHHRSQRLVFSIICTGYGSLEILTTSVLPHSFPFHSTFQLQLVYQSCPVARFLPEPVAQGHLHIPRSFCVGEVIAVCCDIPVEERLCGYKVEVLTSNLAARILKRLVQISTEKLLNFLNYD